MSQGSQGSQPSTPLTSKSAAEYPTPAGTPASSSSASASAAASATAAQPPRQDIRIAVICQSNMNRSMEAHNRLGKAGYNVHSYGAGTRVKLPGEAQDKPNIYDFGTPYDYIFADLKTKNHAKYTKTGMLNMLDRNRKIKRAPERWQDCKSYFDLIICYEKRVFETVVTDIAMRAHTRLIAPVAVPPPPPGASDAAMAAAAAAAEVAAAAAEAARSARPVHVINLDTTDNHAEAHNGALLTASLVKQIAGCADWEDEITGVLDAFEKKNKKNVLHTVLFY